MATTVQYGAEWGHSIGNEWCVDAVHGCREDAQAAADDADGQIWVRCGTVAVAEGMVSIWAPEGATDDAMALVDDRLGELARVPTLAELDAIAKDLLLDVLDA